ncbi:Fe-only nitrogenase accessory AnfO family protein [Methanogenium organophilum]|uniref:Nitrogenase n=1 Tax=Methanogenium organophilum TaxID=2199 RepID=A0A9X9S8A2_METOG|nr:Fe-only nitrogenase accessory AnfO family protein [Methanogenium organophilum]WAI02570.1 nitrogenase [Methanogenium organophilum]
MAAEIAAIVDANGRTGLLNEPGQIVVYRRTEAGWDTVREMPVSLDQCRNLPEMRRKMTDIVQFLGECRIFMAGSASGALYFELEKAGCNIWEISGNPVDFLDSVLEEEEKEQRSPAEAGIAAIPSPEEIHPGEFFISIKDVQGKMPGVTSKQILARFITEGNFRLLEILCDHVPPWIEMEAKRHGYGLQSEKNRPNEIVVRLTGAVAG